MSLKGVAQETLEIVDGGGYVAPSGARRDIASDVAAAIAGTKLYRPDDLAALLPEDPAPGARPRTEVTGETTQVAAHRLSREGIADPLVLNFASARNPGGGFLTGAKAQEEDLARCSALFRCLETQPEYYEVNRRQTSLLYTDHVIYSPRVPWFRVRSRSVIETPFVASVVTAPAPNRGEVLRRDPDAEASVRQALLRRAGYVLAVAQHNGHRALVLGAWGCGVFRNDPAEVAGAFDHWLSTEHFGAAFDHVLFAILDNTRDGRTSAPFRARFASE